MEQFKKNSHEPNFRVAAQRHWYDAEHLLNNKRWPNADQLYGLSAECALKAIMLSLGMPMQNGKPTNKKHSVHIDVLWDEFTTFANGKSLAHYAEALLGENPFQHWRINQRYGDDSLIDEKTATEHKEAAQLAMNCLTTAELEGVL